MVSFPMNVAWLNALLLDYCITALIPWAIDWRAS
jgi:hypothetical protein